MPYIVVTLNPTVITSPNPNTLEAAQALAASNGGEVLSVEAYNAIYQLDRSQPTAYTSREFKRRIAPMIYKLGDSSPALQNKWDRVLKLLDSFDTVNVTAEPLKSLIARAVVDNLLTQAEADALATPPTPP